MKKGPLSNEEKLYIEESHDASSVDKLAEEMDRSTSILQKFINTLDAKETKEETKEESKTMQLLARNAERGVVVMTESASSHFDENRTRTEPPKRYTNIIHKIKED